MSLYEEEVLKARKRFLKINSSQEKELLKLYKELANQLSNEIATCRTSSQDAYLRKLDEIVEVNIQQLNTKLNKMVKANIDTSSKIASAAESVYYQSITKDATLRAIFQSMPINNSRKVVSKLIQGNYYKDGKTLDQRLWNIAQKNKNDINTLIKVNVLKGANARELAKQVDKYVNPMKRIEAKTIETGMSQKIAYQSQRLARTSITHAFGETTIENAKTNPFNKGIKWNLSASHSIRMHGKTDVCDDYSGRVFKPNDIPLQHPNCLCYFTEENTDIDQAIKELKAWTKGESNPKLDKWYKNNKLDNELNDNKSDIIKPRTFNEKIQTVKEKIRVNNGITTEDHLKEAGKIVQDELIENRSILKVNLDNAQKEYNSFGWDNLLNKKDNLSKINRGFIEPQELGYKTKEEAYSGYKEVQKEIDKLINDTKLSEARNKLFEAKNDYKGTQEQNILELKKKLSEVRAIGNANSNIKSHLNNSRSPMVKVITNAYDSYPKDWVEKSISHGVLKPKKVDRGYYSEWDKVIAISGDGGDRSLKTALHELGHRFERAVPEIKDAEKLFYERRTKGEALQWLGYPYASSEKSRFDKFLDKYMGKDYGDSAYELVSMGFEYAYTNPTLLWNDEDFATWIYGILTLY